MESQGCNVPAHSKTANSPNGLQQAMIGPAVGRLESSVNTLARQALSLTGRSGQRSGAFAKQPAVKACDRRRARPCRLCRHDGDKRRDHAREQAMIGRGQTAGTCGIERSTDAGRAGVVIDCSGQRSDAFGRRLARAFFRRRRKLALLGVGQANRQDMTIVT